MARNLFHRELLNNNFGSNSGTVHYKNIEQITDGWSFPDVFKRTIVIPLLKKSKLDGQDLKNYRPVFNLSYLSKLMEKVFHARMLVHLEAIGAMPME